MIETAPNSPGPQGDDLFLRELEPLVAALQREFRRIVRQLETVRTPTELQRALSISYNMSWRIMRIVGDDSPIRAGSFVPAHVSNRNFADAAERCGLLVQRDRLENASSAFHEFVTKHAGDRATFDTIMASLTGVDVERIETDSKRSAYRANRQIFGRGLRAALGCNIVRPAGEPGRVDLVTLHAAMGLTRLRPSASLRIGTRRLRTNPSDVLGGRIPIDQEAYNKYGAPLLLECMDTQSPPVREVPGPDGSVETHLVTPSLGIHSEVSCILADVLKDASIEPNEGEDHAVFDYRIAVRSPCEIMIQDVLIHESLFTGERPDFVVLSEAQRATIWPARDSLERLPVQEHAGELHRPPSSLVASGMPNYRDTVTAVFSRLGWGSLGAFRMFRAEVEFPVLNSVLWMRFMLSSGQSKE